MKIYEHATLFPVMPELEFGDLVASIREQGLREPIVTYKDQILDGRHRHKACSKAQVDADRGKPA